MKKIVVCAGLMAVCLLSLSAMQENLIVNSDLKEKSPVGYPVNWNLRTKDTAPPFSSKDGIVLLNPKTSLVLSQTVSLTPGKSYRLSWEIRGSGSYQIYCEWSWVTEERKVNRGGSGGTQPRKTAKDWQCGEIRFKAPAIKVNPYVAVVMKVPGEIELRNLSLREVLPEELEKDRVEMLGGIWNFGSGSGYDKDRVFINGGRKSVSVLEKIPVESGKYYKLTFNVIGKGVTQESTGFHPFRPIVRYSAKETCEMPWDDVWNTSVQHKTYFFETPKDCRTIGLACEVGPEATVYFSDFKLVQADRPKSAVRMIELESPFYRDAVYSSMPLEAVTGRVSFPQGTKSAVIEFNGLKQALSAPGRFSFPVKDLSVGKHLLKVTCDGIKYVETRTITKYAPAPSEAALGKDRYFYVNGKRFFCNSVWDILLTDDPDVIYYAARRGVTMIKPYWNGKEALKGLDAAQKYGVKVILHSQYLNGTDAKSIREFTHSLYNRFPREVREHPAFLGYFMVDEPAWAGIPLEKLINTYEILCKFDPYHPVWINEAPRGDFNTHRLYSQACDIYGIDIYPVPSPCSHSGLEDKMMTSVGKYAAQSVAASNAHKAVWMALQGFSWKALPGEDDGTDYPTSAELRFMTFDSFLNGATGVGFWGTYSIKTLSFFDTLYGATDEIHKYSGILVETPEPLDSGNPAVAARKYRVAGGNYAIYANYTGKLQKFAPLYKRLDAPTADVLEPWEIAIFGDSAIPEPAWQLPKRDEAVEKRAGNPYARYLESLKKRVFYKGKANWIWDAGSLKSFAKVTGRKEFDVDKPVRNAKILYTIDDCGTVSLNGVGLPESKGWSQMFLIPVKLKNGRNEIRIDAENVGGPCGMLCELDIEFADGSRKSIITDNSWFVQVSGGEFKKSFVVEPYGSGAWKDKVEIIEKQIE